MLLLLLLLLLGVSAQALVLQHACPDPAVRRVMSTDLPEPPEPPDLILFGAALPTS
jgi:hypothetical protein